MNTNIKPLYKNNPIQVFRLNFITEVKFYDYNWLSGGIVAGLIDKFCITHFTATIPNDYCV